MEARETQLPGVWLLTPRRHRDARGFFAETWNRHAFAALGPGLDVDFVQDNQSHSFAKNTLRGLHYQAPPQAQAKLVRCLRGAIFDVAVDMRPGSADYGCWTGVELSAENGSQLFIPKGFLHGFLTLTDKCEVAYKCSAAHAPDCDGSVAWDDAEIDIDWPLCGAPVLSDKDRAAPRLAEWRNPFAGLSAGAARPARVPSLEASGEGVSA